ncbi:hypothetical protein BDN70DRAFT_570562 [Pholiota conissans]|uniref:Uncharacterized protein n=1 Tax=Pholiota conissans TaxID=109636 RepID=A0A9P5YPA0_9AGAR|nr:hypothetical protein BDN70DRAFT_570562 [Pholiota conissans]
MCDRAGLGSAGWAGDDRACGSVWSLSLSLSLSLTTVDVDAWREDGRQGGRGKSNETNSNYAVVRINPSSNWTITPSPTHDITRRYYGLSLLRLHISSDSYLRSAVVLLRYTLLLYRLARSFSDYLSTFIPETETITETKTLECY